MSKYDRYDRANIKNQRQWDIHPIWRGIGCLMLIIIPVVAWAAASEFMRIAPSLSWFPQSRSMYQNINLQFIIIPTTIGQIVFTILFMMVGFMIFSIAYAVVYRIAGPPRYGPTDAPPPRVRKRRRR